MKQVLPLLILIILISTTACKKQIAPHQENYTGQWEVFNTTNSSLPNNQVNAIAIDKNDVKWIGTVDGLVRINNAGWTIFNQSNTALPSSFIRALAVEADGSVWVATDKGLAQYNGTNWKVYTSDNSVITDNGIMCITHDAVRKITWVATEKELVKIENNTWTRFDALEDDLILSMAVDKDGVLWLGTFYHFAFRGRIRKFTNDILTTYNLDQLGYASTFPKSIAIDKNNAVYAVLSGTSVKSVLRFQNNEWQEVQGPANATGLKTIVIDDDKIWIGGNKLSLFGSAQSPVWTLPGGASHIQAMAIDSKHKKWMGTVDGGLLVFD